MQYGAMNFPVKPVLEELEKIASLGFDYMELTLDPPRAHYSTVLQQKKDLLNALDRHKMGLVCHLPTFVSTADLTESIRKASLDEVLFSMETAAELKAMKVVLHPSYVNGLGIFVMDEVKKYAFECFEIATSKARELGLCLCVENMFPAYQAFFKPSHFFEVFEKYPTLKMTIDTGHACINSPGGERLFNFMKTFGDRIGHVHVSDNHGKGDEHLPVGKGTVDFPKFVKKLKEQGYNDTVTLEIFSERPKDLTESRERFASMLEKR